MLKGMLKVLGSCSSSHFLSGRAFHCFLRQGVSLRPLRSPPSTGAGCLILTLHLGVVRLHEANYPFQFGS